MMALIQINQKLLHITITLLIYGVGMETAKCPEVCHCVETSVVYNGNASRSEQVEESVSLHRFEASRRPPEEVVVGRVDGEEEEEDEGNGTSVEASRHGGGKRNEYYTYQITCNDGNAVNLRDLPDPTTQLIIQRATFRSPATFYRTLRESSTQLSLLTDLSITNCAVEDGGGKEEEVADGEPRKAFLPFASLQNPKLRSKEPQPEGVARLLLILNLSNNTLKSLPGNVFKPYPNLQTLDLSGNLIEELDDEVFGGLVNLLRLDLHGNRISDLNELVFKNLTKLLTLDMSRNAIANIAPSTFQYLTSLNTLILSENPLSAKQQSMILLGTGKRLQIVDASKTGLKQIPGTLERSVQTLNLGGNFLSSIQCGDLDSYSLLTYLDLARNKISYVEDDALGRLELLRNLQIGENNLFQIPKSLPNNLEILNLSYNNIQNVTNSDFLNLSLLKELSISYNQVNNVEEGSFDNLSQLRVLDLSHNPILILPNMYGLPRLATLNLSYFTNIPNHVRYEEFPAQAPESIRVLNLESSPLLTRTFLQDTKTLQSFANLEELYLRFSNLTTLRKDVFGFLPKLRLLKVEGNPWHCEREILKLSEWLREHGTDDATDDDSNDVNTAHCATPPNLHKTPLASLTRDDFADDDNDTDDEEDAQAEDASARRNETEAGVIATNNTVDGSGGNETEPETETEDGYGISGGNATTEESKRSTETADGSSTKPPVTKAEAMDVKDTPPPPPSSSSSSSRSSMTTATTTTTSALHRSAHPRLILVTFVGAVALAATAVTALHFARARKSRSYERQSHDIEVHSISSVGNELW